MTLTRMRVGLFILLLLNIVACSTPLDETKVFEVETDNVLGQNTQFWKASGTDLLYGLAEEPSGQALLNRMEETQSCVFLRNHGTLSARHSLGMDLGIEVYSEDDKGNPIYDFSRVNRIYREFVKRGLKPIVECDYIPKELLHGAGTIGNDEGLSIRNAGPKDWGKWRALLVAFVKNLVDEFGADEVRTWYFEVWNEPDGWNAAQIDVFFKMYDVFVDAVTSVDQELKVGGPAVYSMSFLEKFLDHVVYGTNGVTGLQGTRIDFISYHIYGLSGSWLNNSPVIKPSVDRFTQQILWIQRLFNKYGGLKDVEFHLNEWGMSSHFQRTVEEHPDLRYRNTEESALFLTKLVDCLYAIEDNYKFPTHLMLYWGGAWEAAKDDFFAGHRTLTTAGNIPKPIQTGFEILSKLGSERLAVTGNRQGERLGIIATKSDSNEFDLVLYNYNETDDDYNLCDRVNVQLQGITAKDYFIEEYSMDRGNNNTYREWEGQGRPETSTDANLGGLMEAANLSITNSYSKTAKEAELVLEFSLPRHSMRFIKIREKL